MDSLSVCNVKHVFIISDMENYIWKKCTLLPLAEANSADR